MTNIKLRLQSRNAEGKVYTFSILEFPPDSDPTLTIDVNDVGEMVLTESQFEPTPGRTELVDELLFDAESFVKSLGTTQSHVNHLTAQLFRLKKRLERG